MLEQLLPFAGLWALAVICICLGFHWSKMRRRRAECAEYGHTWQEVNVYIPAANVMAPVFKCSHCGKRAEED